LGRVRQASRWRCPLLDAGVQQQDKVAQYLYNGPEYLESVFAAFKAGLVPVNTNYRYADEELIYLWDNADAVAVVFHGAFTERIDAIRGRLPKIKTWLWVDDGTGPYPEWAIPYEEAATTESERLMPPWGRSDDDILLVYTGGTTGLPKGVMYRQDDLIRATVGGTNPSYRVDPDYHKVRRTLTSPGLRTIPACPLMHGTGLYLGFSR
jgi:fatty-acyl-CoA synthase